jgi:hypothetical protein
LAGTSWGANAPTLRTASSAFVYSTAEYCAPVWMKSEHINKVDVQLNNVMRIITGSVKSTSMHCHAWLPVLANIAPPNLRRGIFAFRVKNSKISHTLTYFSNYPTQICVLTTQNLCDRFQTQGLCCRDTNFLRLQV